MSTRYLLPLCIMLYCLPFIGTYLMAAYDPAIATKNLFRFQPVSLLFITCYIAIGILLAKRLLREDKWAWMIVALGLVYLGGHVSQMDAAVTGYDGRAHASTISYIAKYETLQPISAKRSEAHQPPLYYVTAATIYSVSKWLGFNSFAPLNFTALLIFTIFLIYAARLTVAVLSIPWLRYLVIVAIMAWPANLVHCCRVTNDIPMYAIMMMFVYYSVIWYQREERHVAFYMIALAALGFLVKASAIVMLAMGLTAGLCKLWQRANLAWIHHALPRKMPLLMLILAAFAMSNTARVVHYNYTHHQNLPHLLGTAAKPKYAKPIINIPDHYFTFDYRRFLQKPLDTRARNFWNVHAKSFLYGRNKPLKHREFAILLNTTFLLVVLSSLLLLCYRRIVTRPPANIPELLIGFYGCMIAAMISIQVVDPMHGWAEVRHVYPAVVIFLLFYASMIQFAAQNSHMRLYYFNVSLLVLLALFTGTFSVAQFF